MFEEYLIFFAKEGKTLNHYTKIHSLFGKKKCGQILPKCTKQSWQNLPAMRTMQCLNF